MKKILFIIFLGAFALPVSSYDRLNFEGVLKNPAFSKPQSAISCGGKIIVSDLKSGNLFIFEKRKLVKKVERFLKRPGGLACSGDKFYVSDLKDSRVKVFDLNGKFLWDFAGSGSMPGQLNKPQSVAVDLNGMVYVANTGNGRVEIFNGDGVVIRGFYVKSPDGKELSPVKISVDRALNIYIACKDGMSIFKYGYDGSLKKEISVKADSLFVDDYGFMYTTDSDEGKVREVSPDGRQLGVFGTRGRGRSEFKDLSDIYVMGEGDIILTDKGNRKVAFLKIENKLRKEKLTPMALPAYFTVKGPADFFKHHISAFDILPSGEIVAYLSNERELVLIAKKRKKVLARYGKEQGQVKSPGDIISFGKKIYVADTGNNRVAIFDLGGSFQGVFGEGGGLFGKKKEGKFNSPMAITVNSRGRIYVADTKNARVQAFSEDGLFLFAVGPNIDAITMEEPVSIRCDENDNLYILDARLRKVVVTDASGSLIKVWDDSGRLMEPAVIDYDGKGYFYILDRGAFSVKVFDKEGNFINSFFAKGRGLRELSNPAYMKISGDKIYISDIEKMNLLSYELRYIPSSPAKPVLMAEKGTIKVSLGKRKKNRWIKSYNLYRKVGENPFEKLGSFDKKGTWRDKNLKKGNTYYYAASCVSVKGDEGSLSNAASVYLDKERMVSSSLVSSAGGKNIAPVEIEPVELGYIFSANYKYYQNHPIGRIALVNNTDKTYKNVQVSFALKDFMDFPTNTRVEKLLPHTRREVPLNGVLNNKVLGITEDTPIQAHLEAVYYVDGKEKKIELNKPVKVLSKNAIIWNNPRRLANFITPKDPPVFSFSRSVLKGKDEFEKSGMLNENVFTAMLMWEALGDYGLSYLSDPVNPYSRIKSSGTQVLDTVQFPRDTLKLKSGDCDDLTALFASLFEASGVHTALLDYPSHIAVMIDTEKNNLDEIGIPRKYLIKHEGTYWLGIETTMVAKSFIDSFKHQAAMFKNNSKSVGVIDVRKAWADFEPVTLPDTDFGKQLDIEKIKKRVSSLIGKMLNLKYEYISARYKSILKEKPGDKEALINLGVLNGEFGKYQEAKKCFARILAKTPDDASALNNMGNVEYLKGNYEKARDFYYRAAKADGYDANIWLNLARVAVKLGRKDDVKTFAEKAIKMDSSLRAVASKLIKE